jgi:glutaredoxin
LTDSERPPDVLADRPSTAGWNWPAILVLGRDTCEDTTRSRRLLDERAIPYDYKRVDREPEADEWIRRLNDDVWVTPTILIGDPNAPSQILREPSDEELDAALGLGGAGGS